MIVRVGDVVEFRPPVEVIRVRAVVEAIRDGRIFVRVTSIPGLTDIPDTEGLSYLPEFAHVVDPVTLLSELAE